MDSNVEVSDLLGALFELEPADVARELKELEDQMRMMQKRKEILRDLLELMHFAFSEDEVIKQPEQEPANASTKKPGRPLKGTRPPLDSNLPLYPDKIGVWVARINGRTWTFGPWREPEKALAGYHNEVAYITKHNMRPLDSPFHVNNRRKAPKAVGHVTLAEETTSNDNDDSRDEEYHEAG